MQSLKSYLGGRWVEGSGAKHTLLNPATEEPLAVAMALDASLAEAVQFGRANGGAALRAWSFAERGAALLRISRAMHERRDELLELAMRNGGNTRGDAKFDIDGASGTLAYYAGLGKSLGDARFALDGDAEPLGRSPRFVGQHVRLPRRGLAVFINAFNFPAWGLGEKLACAVLAGMPVLVKPATSTALVTHRIVELAIEAGALPEGALSLLVGPAGDLLDQLGGEDVLSFTGGSHTAATLRASRAVVERSVRINVEADSLNAAVLGPDVEPGSDTFGLFVRDVAKDTTQKTGQKCTAIRRVFCTKDRLGAVTEALAERLGEVVVGDPTDNVVTMGPVATAGQFRDVRAGIERLRAEGKVLVGSEPKPPVGVPDGKGYFVPPTLITFEGVDRASVVHEGEVFGPVLSVIPIDSHAASAASAVRLGGGGLVASIYTDDRTYAEGAVLELASSHGRVFVGSAKIADVTPGPGTVLPQSIHGGPGRAGGGEELGGLRGLDFYTQRVAVQGDRALLDSVFGAPR